MWRANQVLPSLANGGGGGHSSGHPGHQYLANGGGHNSSYPDHQYPHLVTRGGAAGEAGREGLLHHHFMAYN